MTSRRYYILEHPTRGVLRDMEWNDAGTKQGRFSVNGMRGDDSCMRFATPQQAEDARLKLSAPMQAATRIRCSQPDGSTGPMDSAWPVVSV